MKKLRLNTIGKKLCFSVVVIGLVFSILLGALLFPLIYDSLERKTVKNLSQVCEQSVTYIDSTIDRYEIYSRTIRNDDYLLELVNDYLADGSDANRERLSMKLSGYINTFSYLSGIMLLLDGDVSCASVGSALEADNIVKSSWYRSYKSNGYSRQFSYIVDRSGGIPEEEWEGGYLLLSYPYHNRAVNGDIVFLLPFSVFDEAIKPYIDNGMDTIIFDRNNMPLYEYVSDKKSGTGVDIERVRSHIVSSGNARQETSDNSDGIDMIAYSRYGGLKLAVHVSNRYIIGDFRNTIALIFILLMLLIVAFIVTISVIISRRIKPLHTITEQINAISDDRLDVTLDVRSGDELETLATSFNKMLSRIKQYLNERIESGNRQRELEYSLFLAQVDPHFIYKSLNVVSHLAKQGRNDELIEVNNSLTAILRDRLRISKIDSLDTVGREIELIESYLTIQRARYGDCIAFEKEIDSSLLDEKIPKNIIQNFVENAVFHGILLNVDEDMNIVGGTIKLQITDGGDSIEIQVTDNGHGMTDETLSKYFTDDFSINISEEKGKHTGIKNMRERLSYLYGGDYSINVLSSVGVGTKVTLVLKKVR